jgi:hypothetical protein
MSERLLKQNELHKLERKLQYVGFTQDLRQFQLNYNIVNIIMKLKGFFIVTVNFY